MTTLRLTVREYVAMRDALPRGPFGPFWPGGASPVILIVEEPPADVPPALVTAAAEYARRWRS